MPTEVRMLWATQCGIFERGFDRRGGGVSRCGPAGLLLPSLWHSAVRTGHVRWVTVRKTFPLKVFVADLVRVGYRSASTGR
eukprot:880553-Rhodomonas_salina.1